MTRKILVVDDSIAIGRQLTKILQEEIGGYEVVGHAKNGAEAVMLFKSLKPDVVLMDIVMPMMDGLQALRALTKLDPKAKVVVVSSVGGMGQTVEEALRLGALSVVSKPFESAKIKATLDRIFLEE